MVIITVLLSVVIAFLPAAIWLAFFLNEDDHAEPISLIIKTFLYGVFMSMPALYFQLFFQQGIGILPKSLLFTIALYATIEEISKYWAAYATVRWKPEFDQPIDAMIYMVVAGLGFATVENIFVLSSFGASGFTDIYGAMQALLLRLIGATLLHTLASALIGYFWSKGIIEGHERSHVVFGIIVATVVHTIFNYLVYIMQNTNLLIPSLFLIGVTFFVLKDFEELRRIEEDNVV